jgi:hypothetical protein
MYGLGLVLRSTRYVQRVGGALQFEAARDDYLEHLAVHDRFLAAVDGVQVFLLVPALLHAGGEVECLAGEHGDRLRYRGADPSEECLHPGDGIVPGFVHPLGAVVEVDGVGDKEDGAVHVVVHSHVRDEVQRHFGQVQVVLGRAGQLLPVPHGLPAEEAHQAGGEGRQAREALGLQRGNGVPDGVDGAAVDRNAHGRFADPVRLAVLAGQGGPGACADE